MRPTAQPPAALVCVCLALLLGCTTTVSRVPRGVPRGYVEFRPLGHAGGPITIEEVAADGWSGVPLGTAGYTTKKARLRAALPPGPHRFSVNFGSAHQLVDINVRAGYVTPVLIQFYDQQKSATYYYHGVVVHRRFRMSVTAAEPVRLK